MSDEQATTPAGASRRRVLAVGAVGTAGAAVALTGCTVYGGQPDPPPPPPPPAGGGPDDDGAEVPAGTPVAATTDVPVGGGFIASDQGIVITQPAAGEFRAFSATCTHQGCLVTEVSDGTIICRCHDSRFSIEDGAVVQAAQGSNLTPETQDPLPEVGIVVDGDTIALPG
jgi:Rieske Fe-S protein